MLEPQVKKAKYALLAVKFGGINYLVTQIKQRTYRKETFIGLARYLDAPNIDIKSKIEYSLQLASPEDIEELLQHLGTEGQDAIFDLIQRKWFYDSGFHSCYVARTLDTHELCYTQWTISRRDANADSDIFLASFPRLGHQEMQLEHAYTFKKYRGNKIMPAVMNQLFDIARRQGFQRVITYVLDDNQASLKGCYNVGFKDFEIVRRTRLPLSTKYEISNPAGKV